MKESLAGRARVTGAAAVGAPEAERPPLTLSRHHARNLSERAIGGALFACAALSALTTLGIILVLIVDTVRFFQDVPIQDFLFGTTWTALMNVDRQFGVLPLVAGTFLMSFLAMVFALPLGVMAAIYLSEYAPEGVRAVLKPILEILAGIPTIVYGFFALTFITPDVLKRIFSDIGPFNVLSAAIAVAILVLPLVASLSEDSLRAVPRSLREGAYGLGATKMEVSTRIVVPAALSGIVAAFILAISRAVGETMVVAIAMGSKPQLNWNPIESMQAMTAYIVQVVSGDEPRGTTVYYSLFAVGMLLFLITLVLNVISQWFVTKFREVYQ
jgi:phosphate transport system permease protein